MRYSIFKPLWNAAHSFTEDCVGKPESTCLIDVAITLKRPRSIDDAVADGVRMTREEFDSIYAVPQHCFDEVKEFADFFDLSVTRVSKIRRTVDLKGKIENFERAFSISVRHCLDSTGSRLLCTTDVINLPEEIWSAVEFVWGFNESISILPQLALKRLDSGYFVPDVCKAYGFPDEFDGSNECIGIVTLGGGYRHSDLVDYFQMLKVDVPKVIDVPVDAAFNAPGIVDFYDHEVTMNIEIAGAVAPGASIAVYFSQNNERGFFNAIAYAVHDKVNRPSVISLSWGAPEKKWSARSLHAFNEIFKEACVLGVTVCAASGNFGVADRIVNGRLSVDFPASSPFVLACGGTDLFIRDGIIVSEMVWHQSDNEGSGGGVSEFFPLPGYQINSRIPSSANSAAFKGRGVPDIAGSANPKNGYKVLLNGKLQTVGGTSAVAPLYAGLIARLNQKKGVPAGFINPRLYSDPVLCRNIYRKTQAPFIPRYKIRRGWNAYTGLGVLSFF